MAKRFYKAVSVKEVEGGYAVQLDGRSLKTPGKLPLIAPNQTIAEIIAGEWDAQAQEIIPATMPVTRLLNVAIERTPENRDQLIQDFANYAGSDLICYRATEPTDLIEAQEAEWNPWIDWAASRGIKLKTTRGVMAVEQDAQSLGRAADYAADLPDLPLTLCLHIMAVLGSAILAMAVMEQELAPAKALELSLIDEAYQANIWGRDEEAQARLDNIQSDYLALCAIIPHLER